MARERDKRGGLGLASDQIPMQNNNKFRASLFSHRYQAHRG